MAAKDLDTVIERLITRSQNLLSGIEATLAGDENEVRTATNVYCQSKPHLKPMNYIVAYLDLPTDKWSAFIHLGPQQ